MTDEWSLKGKVRLTWFGTPLYSQETIETLRQKLIEDVEELFEERIAKLMVGIINRRFGVEVSHGTQ
ncbi:MAG TPA: hypothetical protein ENI53_01510 [Thermoplasmatales archaeon]|nr:hypothetical protein [Thermoplasmatales archaeon]